MYNSAKIKVINSLILILIIFISGCVQQQTTNPSETGQEQTTQPSKSIDSIKQGTGQEQTTQPSKSIDEIKQEAITIAYDELFRNNEKYIGTTIYFKGQILQAQEILTDNYILRVATKESSLGNYFEDTIFINYKGKRLLENDIIEVWGKVKGLKSYTAVLGNEVTIPEVNALYTELSPKAVAKTSEQYEEEYNKNAKIVNSTTRNGNFEVTLIKYGFFTHLKYDTWGDEVTDFRFDIKVKNIGSEKDSFITYDSVILSGSNQYKKSYKSTLDTSDMYEGIVRDGYLLFEEVPKTLTGQIKIIVGYSYDKRYNELVTNFYVII